MNIYRIRQMIFQGDMSVAALKYLLDCHGECEYLDFKIDIDLANDYGCASFAKDVMAMKNVGGGYIVLGVEDKSWKPIGLKNRVAFDTKMLRDKVFKSTGVDVEIDIVQHEIDIDGLYSLFAVILIRTVNKHSKLRVPSVATKDFNPHEKWGIRRGDIYTRNGDSSQRINSDIDLQHLLDNLETIYQEQNINLKRSSEQSSILDLEVGIGEEYNNYGLDGNIYLAFQSFYKDTDITEMFVQVNQFSISKFNADKFFEKIKDLERRKIFYDSKYVGKALKWITSNGSLEEIKLKPNENARVLFLKRTIEPEALHFGFETINSDDSQKNNWRENGTYEIFVDVYGKVYGEDKYHKRTFVVLIDFIQGKEAEIIRSISLDFYRNWFKLDSSKYF